MENEPKKENNNWIIFLILVAFFAGVFSWFKSLIPKPVKYYSKSDLAKLYGVDIKTINKWVATFCDQNELPYDSYKKKRKLLEDMYYYIIECLGQPSDEMPVRSKVEIITTNEELCGNEYRAARNSIRLGHEISGISPEVYAMFNVFPPKIAFLISKKVA